MKFHHPGARSPITTPLALVALFVAIALISGFACAGPAHAEEPATATLDAPVATPCDSGGSPLGDPDRAATAEATLSGWQFGGFQNALITDDGSVVTFGEVYAGDATGPFLWGESSDFLKIRSSFSDMEWDRRNRGEARVNATYFYDLGESNSYVLEADYANWPDNEFTVGVGYWLPIQPWVDSFGNKRNTVLLSLPDVAGTLGDLKEPHVRLEGSYPVPFRGETDAPENYLLRFNLDWAQEDRGGWIEVYHPINDSIGLSIGYRNVGLAESPGSGPYIATVVTF